MHRYLRPTWNYVTRRPSAILLDEVVDDGLKVGLGMASTVLEVLLGGLGEKPRLLDPQSSADRPGGGRRATRITKPTAARLVSPIPASMPATLRSDDPEARKTACCGYVREGDKVHGSTHIPRSEPAL